MRKTQVHVVLRWSNETFVSAEDQLDWVFLYLEDAIEDTERQARELVEAITSEHSTFGIKTEEDDDGHWVLITKDDQDDEVVCGWVIKTTTIREE